MSQTRLEELEKALQLLQGAQSLDETIRAQFAAQVLAAVEPARPQTTTAKTPVIVPPTEEELDELRRGPPPVKEGTQLSPTVKQRKLSRPFGVLSSEVLQLVAQLATHDKPVSVADLEGLLEGVTNSQIGGALGHLYSKKLIHRVKVIDKDRLGNVRELYKYYT